MSTGYADALSYYPNKGRVGDTEFLDDVEEWKRKVSLLKEALDESKCTVVLTGAGISTAAGISDFRGPEGVWTREKQGRPRPESKRFDAAAPTYTHNALRILAERNKIQFLISQNIDGLHYRSRFPLTKMCDLHGNVYTEECTRCKRRYYRTTAVESYCLQPTGRKCTQCITSNSRSTRQGFLRDTVIDWIHDLPQAEFEEWSEQADLFLCLGTSLEIIPCGDFPLKALKRGGKVFTINLQKTKHEKKVTCAIHAKVDDAMRELMRLLFPNECNEFKMEAEPIVEDFIWDIGPPSSRKDLVQKKIPSRKRRRPEENLQFENVVDGAPN